MPTGRSRGSAPPRTPSKGRLALGFASVVASLALGPTWVPPAVVRLRTAETHQTFVAWEATAYAAQGHPRYEAWKRPLLHGAAQLGLQRLRVEVRSGVEQDVDFFRDGGGRGARYRTVNDNDDPFVIEPAGFHFTELDNTIEKVVLPFREALAERGESLLINLCYVSFSKDLPSGERVVHLEPEEYAEFVEATVRHLEARHGFVPDTWELMLEPDTVPEVDGPLLGRMMVAAHRRLAARGYGIRFVAPSTTWMGAAVPYLDGMLTVPGAKEALAELSFHRYRGWTKEQLAAIAAKAESLGIATSQLEKIGADVDALYYDLSVANVSVWAQYTLGGPEEDEGGGYFVVDPEASPPTVTLGRRTRLLRPFLMLVRPGSVRLGVGSDRRAVKPVAFRRPSGDVVVLVVLDRAAAIEFRALPPGRYAVRLTTEVEEVALADMLVVGGEDEPASVLAPAKGVLTLVGGATNGS